MDLNIKNLQLRRGLYWFRAVIPSDLRLLYGRRVVSKCLCTSNLKAGVIMCNIIRGELKKHFESQKGNPMELTQKKANGVFAVPA